MGLGDPYHKHPLRVIGPIDLSHAVGCFHCELPILPDVLASVMCYGCIRCNYYVHALCVRLPDMMHPIHDQHHLTSFEPPSFSDSPNLCNECQKPCLGRFAYHCPTCQFFIHLKCLFSCNHEKHEEHPLVLHQASTHPTYHYTYNCIICGSVIEGFNYWCLSCKVAMHIKCSLIPHTFKSHHVHQLTLSHKFPDECKQVYCDMCEDRDGSELDRSLSHYYCKECDYIAHVKCCFTKQITQKKYCTHEHPMVPDISADSFKCGPCMLYVNYDNPESPCLIKHPRHPEHNLYFQPLTYPPHVNHNLSFQPMVHMYSYRPVMHIHNQEHTLSSEPIITTSQYIRTGPITSLTFKCTECQFSMNEEEGKQFTHPLGRLNFRFYSGNSLFRCDACGQLGKHARMKSEPRYLFEFAFSKCPNFDLHLECFALPGKLLHESHLEHTLKLCWIDNISTSRFCAVCNEEMDTQLWFYFCQECNYAAHVGCVASDLLLTLRSSVKSKPDFCAIIEPDKALFDCQIVDIRPPQKDVPQYGSLLPVLIDSGKVRHMGIATIGDEFQCPKCDLPISTQAGYSCLDEWELHYKNFDKNRVTITNNLTPTESDPLSLLDDHTIDELYCSICNVLIFPPTYSCASCRIFFHKSCAEMPRETLYRETTYTLMAPPFPEGLSKCSTCQKPISSFAYFSSANKKIFDIQCASGAPLLNLSCHNHNLRVLPLYDYSHNQKYCSACKNKIKIGTLRITCRDCTISLHIECALLPPVINHYRAHQHPLELATNLSELDDEYICDACEGDLNPNLWAYRCKDECGIRATSHVTCVINSKKKCHFRYEDECQSMTQDQMLAFRQKEAGIKKYGKRT